MVKIGNSVKLIHRKCFPKPIQETEHILTQKLTI